MSRFIQMCALLLAPVALAPLAIAADPAPGSVVVNQVLLRIDAIAGEENCTFLAPIEQNVLVACFVDDHIRQLHAVKPVPGGPAISGDFKDVNNDIHWSLSETAEGKFNFEIHANSTVQSGQF